jgi:hypothetical protein
MQKAYLKITHITHNTVQSTEYSNLHQRIGTAEVWRSEAPFSLPSSFPSISFLNALLIIEIQT